MADPGTPNYAYTLPTVGLDRDVWGDLENANWSKLDTDLKAVSDSSGGMSAQLTALINNIRAYIEPIGSIKPWPAPTVPPGWTPCDGIEVPRVDWAPLFAVIGTTWGAGNGSTTYNIPDFRSCALVHRDNATFFLGSRGGELSHTLTVAEMPAHSHTGGTDSQGDHNHTYHRSTMTTPAAQLQSGSGFALSESDSAVTSTTGAHAHNVSVANTGGGAAHNNIQPSSGVLWIIKAFNQF